MISTEHVINFQEINVVNKHPKPIIASYTLRNNYIHMLTTERRSKTTKLFSRGQTHKIALLTDMHNIPKVQYEQCQVVHIVCNELTATPAAHCCSQNTTSCPLSQLHTYKLPLSSSASPMGPCRIGCSWSPPPRHLRSSPLEVNMHMQLLSGSLT